MEKDSIVVRIDADNVFWIGAPKWDQEQRTPSVSEMNATVREARGDKGDRPTKLLVQANGDSRHEFVVAALDAGLYEQNKDNVIIKADRNVAHREVARVIKAVSRVPGAKIFLAVLEAD